VVALPRLVVAAPSTGQGKTTIMTGLLAAFRADGTVVSGHKIGPDYIDPGYHGLATGRPGRNLDPFLVGEERIVPLLRHGAAGADLAVIEGVMGLYDGRLGTDGFGSSAHVARLTGSPVVLVIDIERMSRTAGAIVSGLAGFDPRLRVAGVILNRAGSRRNTVEITRAVEHAGLTVFGVLPRDDRLPAPVAQLGMVAAAERSQSEAAIAQLGEGLAEHLDLDTLSGVARSAPDLEAEPWDPAAHVRAASGPRAVVAVAVGSTFSYSYAETTELLEAAGCQVVGFDPATDSTLPAGTQGLYLGGGLPESDASRLSTNTRLRNELREAVTAGIPAIAEGAGLCYLAASLDGAPMAGVLPAAASTMARPRLGYRSATAAGDTLCTRAGEHVTGHEFHRTRTDPAHGSQAAWFIGSQPTGFAHDTWHASYLHVHWAGHPQLAQRFADAVHRSTPHTKMPDVRDRIDVSECDDTSRPDNNTSQPDDTSKPEAIFGSGNILKSGELSDPLRHHGDVEADGTVRDFAVNTYPGPRPGWLDRALHDAVDDAATYPDPEPARAAIARRHHRPGDEILPTAGAAEAFALLARLRCWHKPVAVHPQFTEPHAALDHAGYTVTTVGCRADDDFCIDPAAVPGDADLVIIGNPTNPTGRLHPADSIRKLQRPGRVLVVDEAFMDAVPAQTETLVGQRLTGCLVLRSLTKHWSIPGVRAGYVAGDPAVVGALARIQPPWSVSTAAIAAMVATTSVQARADEQQRALELVRWRESLEEGLTARQIAYVNSAAPYVLARPGTGVHDALRKRGIAVRRADTFPGLDGSWVRIAARPPEVARRLFAALDQVKIAQPTH
jgi:cobyrinic acid a,c-diamide synthase